MTFKKRVLAQATLLAMLTLLSACDGPGGAGATAVLPLEIDRRTTCDLDGMLLADYPGPKAQVRYQGQDAPVFFCDTVELLNTLLRPEQVRPLQAAWVQDMGRARWEQPEGHWIDAKAALYVLGSKRNGSMGPTAATFAQEADAKKFIAEHGGTLYRFADIKPEMVDMSGGVTHDGRM